MGRVSLLEQVRVYVAVCDVQSSPVIAKMEIKVSPVKEEENK